MKKTITIISLILGFAITSIAATDRVETPVQKEFAQKLVSVFGGKDMTLSQAELVRVLTFLQENLPEQTQPTTMTNRLSRQNNFWNAPRNEMHEDRMSIREEQPELIAVEFIKKYDLDNDAMVCDDELSVALENVIGTPKAGKAGVSVARR